MAYGGQPLHRSLSEATGSHTILGVGRLLRYLATFDAKSDVIFLLVDPEFL